MVETIVGVNKYRLDKPQEVEVLTIDNTKVDIVIIIRIKIIINTFMIMIMMKA